MLNPSEILNRIESFATTCEILRKSPLLYRPVLRSPFPTLLIVDLCPHCNRVVLLAAIYSLFKFIWQEKSFSWQFHFESVKQLTRSEKLRQICSFVGFLLIYTIPLLFACLFVPIGPNSLFPCKSHVIKQPLDLATEHIILSQEKLTWLQPLLSIHVLSILGPHAKDKARGLSRPTGKMIKNTDSNETMKYSEEIYSND